MVQISQGVLHEVLEGCGCVAQPKRHVSEIVESQATYGESGILLGLWHHFDPQEPALEIHHGEMCGTCHALQCFMYPGQWIGLPHPES